MRIATVLLAVAAILVVDASVRAATMQAGGDRLVATQNADGGWAFPLTGTSASNIVDPATIGLAAAYHVTGSSTQLAALQNAGTYLLARNNNFQVTDGSMAAALDGVFGGTTYTDFVKTNFYDKLAAGTYQRNGTGPMYDTASYVAFVRASRGGSQANLGAWDVGLGLVAAVSVGASTADWVTGTEAEINELVAGNDYDVLSLGGALYGLARAHATFDPTAGSFASASSVNDLANTLAGFELPTGGFTYNAFDLTPNEAETVQETVYAILALGQIDPNLYWSDLNLAGNYLRAAQLGNGGWADFVGDGESNQVTGEALIGVFSAPEPGSISVLLFGSLAMLRRRRVQR